MKTAVEELSPTRVRLTVEVPFAELEPQLKAAYKQVARQVRVPGFRPGKVPPRIIDQRIGRGVVLEQAVNEAVPQLYADAVRTSDLYAMGRPELEVTKLDDGKELTFTAEVDVRPKFELPDYGGLEISVDDVEVSPAEVDEQLDALRERFAVLKGVDRPAAGGDYVSIDLAARIDGEAVEDAQTSGYSYQIGGGQASLEGLDEALTGMSAGESKTFRSKLAGGVREGEEADVTVTVHSVKVKELPQLDDAFAQTASEFDTLEALTADITERVGRMHRARQLSQAREKVIDALLERIDIPLPESAVRAEIERRGAELDEVLKTTGMSREAFLSARERSEEEFTEELETTARKAVKGGLVLDQVAMKEELGVTQEELTEYVVQQALRMGVAPNDLAKHLTDTGQLSTAVSEVLREKAVDLLLTQAKVTDESGLAVDLQADLTPSANSSG